MQRKNRSYRKTLTLHFESAFSECAKTAPFRHLFQFSGRLTVEDGLELRVFESQFVGSPALKLAERSGQLVALALELQRWFKG
jgi:hypothetical protein